MQPDQLWMRRIVMPRTASSTISTAPIIDVSNSLPVVPPPVSGRRRAPTGRERVAGHSPVRSGVLMRAVSVG